VTQVRLNVLEVGILEMSRILQAVAEEAIEPDVSSPDQYEGKEA
jgi:hypothetical protein